MNIRLSEAQDLIALIKEIENGTIVGSIKMNTPALRASVVLSLYNIIESTITQTLTKIHDEINKRQVHYGNLSKEIRNLLLIYFYKHKQKKTNIHDSLDVIHDTVNLIRGKGHFNLPYEKMIDSYQLYSGNLDAKIIRKIMRTYGITISELYGQKLQLIKNARNTLAHGNQSFEEYGRTIVIKTLEDYINDVEKFLTEVINEGKQYIHEKRYKVKKALERF
ncbi:MAE_28990/MAE_18760 family HEPN-like nuclease [Chromobacterium haemolyticum]|uniref:MAE_28990/MAE_18760 family HEPN-like nuclease n=1 Tax=Chromobacterium haemolyticum TaxID=394935 RepID=UPI00126A3DEB|nr:MAE_28990/MAE_18760 family HEPN-like nuclease [Chromobacterium haemolyticum]